MDPLRLEFYRKRSRDALGERSLKCVLGKKRARRVSKNVSLDLLFGHGRSMVTWKIVERAQRREISAKSWLIESPSVLPSGADWMLFIRSFSSEKIILSIQDLPLIPCAKKRRLNENKKRERAPKEAWKKDSSLISKRKPDLSLGRFLASLYLFGQRKCWHRDQNMFGSDCSRHNKSKKLDILDKSKRSR